MDGPRVLVIARWFPHASEPGLGPFVHEQVRCLREEQGLDVWVVSGRECPLSLRRPHRIVGNWRRYRRGCADLAWQTWEGVPVLYFPFLAGRLSNWLWQAPYRDALLRALPGVRRAYPFDLIHAHTANPDGFAAMKLAELVGVPYVITEHTNPFATLTTKPVLRWQTLAAIEGASRVWCVSHSLQKEVGSYFTGRRQDHIQYLPNGVDTSRFALPDVWRPDVSKPKLLFVGFFQDYKNPLMLLDAFAQVRARIPLATLHLAGDGQLRPAIMSRIAQLGLKDSVKMHGYCGRAEVARLMREECDVFVLPSKSETFGVVLIEALACGKPVVATRCGGPESIVVDSSLGELCPPNDAAELAQSLLRTIARLPEFDAARIRRFACGTFDYRILARTLTAEYRQLLRTDVRAAA